MYVIMAFMARRKQHKNIAKGNFNAGKNVHPNGELLLYIVKSRQILPPAVCINQVFSRCCAHQLSWQDSCFKDFKTQTVGGSNENPKRVAYGCCF